MNRTPIIACVSLLCGLTALVTPRTGRANENGGPRWVVGVGGGVADNYSFYKYHFSFGTFPEALDTGWFASVSARRAIGKVVALHGEAAYLRYGGRFPVFSVLTGSSGYPRGVRVAEIPSVGLGVRLESAPRGEGQRGVAYLDFMPALFVAHWTEGVKYGDEWRNRARATKVAAGFIVSAGMRFAVGERTSLEFGPRYIHSGNLGWTADRNGFGESDGLDELGLSTRMTRAF